MATRESVVAGVINDCVAIKREMVEMLLKEVGTLNKQISPRELAALARMAALGDEAAMAELQRLAAERGHMDGEPMACPLCQEIERLLPQANEEEV